MALRSTIWIAEERIFNTIAIKLSSFNAWTQGSLNSIQFAEGLVCNAKKRANTSAEQCMKRMTENQGKHRQFCEKWNAISNGEENMRRCNQTCTVAITCNLSCTAMLHKHKTDMLLQSLQSLSLSLSLSFFHASHHVTSRSLKRNRGNEAKVHTVRQCFWF